MRLPDNYSDLNIWRYWVPASTRTFRVFVSSSPEDLKAERDALQRDVFPKLRALCEQHGARSQAIEVNEGTTLGELFQSYVDKFPRLTGLGLAYAVNHEYSDQSRVLKDGDEIALIPPVSGG